ncbi:purine permease 3-like [Cornus florida]|uniref:purine permease 3-like n=1 Tax=Cornus florida TaxID=4283 RepID=UPI002897B5AD|nr:purine permease 3-like [Cornus florida]
MGRTSKPVKALLVLLNCLLISIGQVAGLLLVRLYYLHGGKRRWLSAWILSAGFPILIFPIAISYAQARATTPATTLLVTPRLAAAGALLGILLGLDGYLYTFGLSYLPISVSSLLGSTQLAFTAIFAFFIVKQKFTHYSVNAVVLMTFGSVVLGLHMNGDRPSGVSNGKYLLGFFMTIAAAGLHGFIMPAVEYTHLKAGVAITFNLVMQFQFIVSMFATLFCTVPMIINKDFQAIPEEAREYDLGESKYYMVLVLAAVAMQFLIIGSLGVIFCSTSLLGGLVSSLLLPVQQIFAVMFLPESFNADKGIALAMCLWGFSSDFYGEYKVSRRKPATKLEPEQEEVV